MIFKVLLRDHIFLLFDFSCLRKCASTREHPLASRILKRKPMTARSKLLTAPPYPVEQTLKRLGANLRRARLRRKLTIEQVAEKIGTGMRVVADAEKGKPSTSIVVYAALLWVVRMEAQLAEVAAPERDTEGQALARFREPVRARKEMALDNDF